MLRPMTLCDLSNVLTLVRPRFDPSQGFFNPRSRSFIAPTVPGQAYSFTQDGFWEFAKYRVTPNRKSSARTPELEPPDARI